MVWVLIFENFHLMYLFLIALNKTNPVKVNKLTEQNK